MHKHGTLPAAAWHFAIEKLREQALAESWRNEKVTLAVDPKVTKK